MEKINIIVATACFLSIALIGVLKARSFWEALLGEDNRMQFIEASLAIWMVLFVFLVIGDFCLNLKASDAVWWSMDSIFLIGIGARTTVVITRNKKNNHE